MNGIHIRTIIPSDNINLARIVRSTLAEFGLDKPGTVYYDDSTDHLFELFQEPRSVYYVAEQDGQLLGGAGIYPSSGLPPDTCELVKMYLVPAARGMGLGQDLIRRSIDFAKTADYHYIYLETMPELRKALSVYEKFGFKYLDGPMGNTGHYHCDRWMLLEL